MKIAVYISPAHGVPPREEDILAPWELVSDLADGLVDRGHQVNLYAAKESQTKANLRHFEISTTYEQKNRLPREHYKKLVYDREFELFEKMMNEVKTEGIGIVHVHHPVERLAYFVQKYPDINFLFTLHDPISAERAPKLAQLAGSGNCFFISISNSQRGQYQLPFAATVYNGIHLEEYPFSGESADYNLIAGRIIPDKGDAEAIEAVRRSSGKLIIAGKVYQDSPGDYDYFKNKIQPNIDNEHVFLESEINKSKLIAYYSQARSYLFPVKWEEPFGLVMIEAMSVGCPIIAYARGAVPEIVKDGITGFIINQNAENIRGDWQIKQSGVEGLSEAINRIKSMGAEDYMNMRKQCRQHVFEKFTFERMISGYEEIYRQFYKEEMK